MHDIIWQLRLSIPGKNVDSVLYRVVAVLPTKGLNLSLNSVKCVPVDNFQQENAVLFSVKCIKRLSDFE